MARFTRPPVTLICGARAKRPAMSPSPGRSGDPCRIRRQGRNTARPGSNAAWRGSRTSSRPIVRAAHRQAEYRALIANTGDRRFAGRNPCRASTPVASMTPRCNPAAGRRQGSQSVEVISIPIGLRLQYNSKFSGIRVYTYAFILRLIGRIIYDYSTLSLHDVIVSSGCKASLPLWGSPAT